MTVLEIPREEIQTKVNRFREAIFNLDETEEIAQTLHQDLIAPVERHLDPEKPLIIVPHGLLHFLPFGALQDPASEKYLVQKYSTAVVPNARFLLLAESGELEPLGNPLVVGNPDGTLIRAEEEAEIIAVLLDAQAALGAAAEEAWIQAALETHDVVHLGTHGIYDEEQASSSYLQLAPPIGGPADDPGVDGKLEAWEIARLDLSGLGLAVLSACDTALGSLSPSDEVTSLARSFLQAGTRNVLTTLWPIDDEGSKDFMIDFYENFAGGDHPREALRKAQEMMIASEQWSHPYYWSSFMLYGADSGTESAGLLGKVRRGLDKF